MGTDVYGWVEFRNPVSEQRDSIIKLDSLLDDRNYEVFAWLFGICRKQDIPMRWDFVTVAFERGLPPDVSDDAATEYADISQRIPQEAFGATWISWREMQTVDWDEPIEDRIIETYNDKPGGGTVYWRSQFLRKHANAVPGTPDSLTPGQRWAVNDHRYEVVATRRRDVLEPNWTLLFRLMETLADKYGDESVRMVVWFVI